MRARARSARLAAPIAAVLLAACAPGPEPPPEFRQSRAWAYVGQQIAFGPRYAGQRGHERQMEWLLREMGYRADTVFAQPFTMQGEGGRTLRQANVVARFRPELADRVLLVAHRDTRRRADGAPDPADRTRTVPGANVNASGVAVLVEMAQLFKERPPPVGVDLLFADGDDYSDATAFSGTRHFLASMPGYRARYAVVLQAVGDYDARFPMDPASAPEPARRMWEAARALRYDSVFVAERAPPLPSQAQALSAAGIPAVVVRDPEYGPLNVRWHAPDDVPQFLKGETLVVVGRTLAAAIYAEPGTEER